MELQELIQNLDLKYKLNWRDRYFLKAFPQKIDSLIAGERKAIDIEFIKVYSRESINVTDEQSQGHLLMCSYVLASYTVLSKQRDNEAEILENLTKAFQGAGGGFVKWSMRIMLWIKPNKKKFIEGAAIRSSDSYGELFDITTEKEEHQFACIVRKCGYYDFFKKNGKPELTKIFCEWDSLWTEEINKRKIGIHFIRPTTIADNGSECRFEFHYSK